MGCLTKECRKNQIWSKKLEDCGKNLNNLSNPELLSNLEPNISPTEVLANKKTTKSKRCSQGKSKEE